MKIRLFELFFGPKADFSGKKRTNFRPFFFLKGPVSDQGLIKRSYLAALLSVFVLASMHISDGSLSGNLLDKNNLVFTSIASNKLHCLVP